jgi:glycyl-tRNA synthetase beta chain
MGKATGRKNSDRENSDGENSLTKVTKGLLIELLVEELPPKSLKKLSISFTEGIAAGLKAQGLAVNDAIAIPFASPRRLAVYIEDVSAQAADKQALQKLMPVAVGLDANDQPTPALLKKLSSLCGDAARSSIPQLKRRLEGKVETLFFDRLVKGATLAEGLQKALNDTLARLPVATIMAYQLSDGWTTVNFVRPAHGLVALHGEDIVPVSALGLTAGRETQGHRFEACARTLVLTNADSYRMQLETEGAVIASFDERRNRIRQQLNATSVQMRLKPVDDPALLEEVTALVERPNVLTGKFDSAFLDVPQECLILTMKANQKYFPLLEDSGRLANKFCIVSNISPADTSQIIAGNERVLRSRLADAKFFFDQDRKKTLASRVEGLRKVVYHNKLGTQAERVERIWAIAQAIGLQLGGTELAAKAGEAAMLSKADLLTDMVGEFPELQGIMGRYYAKHDGLADEVADAIEDHYKPRFAGDELPRSLPGICVALADKLESLVGMFGIGQAPTGDKDPFALRRHALGLIRILVDKDLPLHLDSLITQAITVFGARLNDASDMLNDFIYDRLRYYFGMEAPGQQATGSSESSPGADNGGLTFSPQQIDAVLALRPQRLSDVKRRLEAVRAFTRLPEAESLATTNKRVRNILRKADGAAGDAVDTMLFETDAEKALHRVLSQIVPKADKAFSAGDYNASLQTLAALKTPVDNFFDNVMVNTEDEAQRSNRLALLARLDRAMNRVADISRLAA